MSKRKVFVVGNHPGFSKFIHDVVETNYPEQAELFIFTGGADVDPSLYGEKEGNRTHFDKMRDEFEIKHFEYAIENNIPMVGICRGGQLLTVLSGGKLIQHVTNHGTDHVIKDKFDNSLLITSSHHQMFYPYDMHDDDYELIAWSLINRSTTYLNGDDLPHKFNPEKQKEAEVVWYPNTKSLCIQGHPEWMIHITHSINIINQYIDRYIWNALSNIPVEASMTTTNS
jgi:anthranilate/para-aminobenzoate synthase component II